MKTTLYLPVEIIDKRHNDKKDKWITIQLNESDITRLEDQNMPIFFNTATGARIMIQKVGDGK